MAKGAAALRKMMTYAWADGNHGDSFDLWDYNKAFVPQVGSNSFFGAIAQKTSRSTRIMCVAGTSKFFL